MNHILFQKKWDRIIFDEGHHLRNPNTAANISANALKATIKWLISGTPIQNKKKDFSSKKTHRLCSKIAKKLY